MSNKKYFTFDTETGGLQKTEPTPSLLTLYGVLSDENLNQLDEIHLKIRPKNGIYIVDRNALAVNKINIYEHDLEADDWQDASNEFLQFIKKHKDPENSSQEKIIPVGQNIQFDIFFGKKLFPDWESYFSRRVLDLPSVAHALILCDKLPSSLDPSLKNLAEYFNFSYDGAHKEKFDVQLSTKILKELLKLLG